MNDDNDRQSADEALEQQDIYNPHADNDTLPGDNDPPAAPADDVPSALPIDDPATDTGVDPDERYQEGVNEAADSSEQAVGPDERPRPLEPEDDEE